MSEGQSSLFQRSRRSRAAHLVTVSGYWHGRGTVKLIWRSTDWRDGRPKFQARFKRRNPVDHKRLRAGPMEVWW